MPKKTVNRAPYFVSAMIASGMGSYLLSWSYYRDSLGDLFPSWTEAQLSLPFSLHNITVFVVIAILGPLLKKVKSRIMLTIAAFAILIGLGLFPILPVNNPSLALFLLIILFAVIAALSAGIGPITSLDIYQPWFPDHVGMASGLWIFYAGLSPILIGAYLGILIPAFGVLRAVQILGITLSCMILLTLFFAKKPGEDVNLPPKIVTPSSSYFADLTTKQMFKTSAFYHIYIFNIMIRCSGIIISDLGGSIANDFGIPTLAGLLFAPANGLSALVGGFLSERIKLTNLIFMYCIVLLLGASSLLIGGLTATHFLILLGIFLIGFGYGGSTVSSVIAVRLMFGSSNYAQNMSVVLTSVGFTTLSLFVSGNMLTASGGSYTPVFILVFSLASIGFLDSVIMKKTKSFSRISHALDK